MRIARATLAHSTSHLTSAGDAASVPGSSSARDGSGEDLEDGVLLDHQGAQRYLSMYIDASGCASTDVSVC